MKDSGGPIQGMYGTPTSSTGGDDWVSVRQTEYRRMRNRIAELERLLNEALFVIGAMGSQGEHHPLVTELSKLLALEAKP